MENVSEIIVEFIIVLLEFRWKDLIFSLELMVSIAVQVLLKVQVLLIWEIVSWAVRTKVLMGKLR